MRKGAHPPERVAQPRDRHVERPRRLRSLLQVSRFMLLDWAWGNEGGCPHAWTGHDTGCRPKQGEALATLLALLLSKDARTRRSAASQRASENKMLGISAAEASLGG